MQELANVIFGAIIQIQEGRSASPKYMGQVSVAGKVDSSSKLSAPQKGLLKLGLRRDIDLALHLPLRYEDETRITDLSQAREGDLVQIEGVVTSCEVSFRPRRQLLVSLSDGGVSCILRFFNFYPSQQKSLAVGNRIRARGELRGGLLGWTMMHPQTRAATGALPKSLTPVYPTVAALPQAYLRKAVLSGLAKADLEETIAPEVSSALQPIPLWTLRDALNFLHHPSPDVSLCELEDHTHPAWQRLKAEELLAQQLSQLLSRREREHLHAPKLSETEDGLLYQGLLKRLPFQLTAAQKRVVEEIVRNLAQPQPMHRLLQGDVGSGKTVVAALAAARCMDAGWQCALMAPTEILAEQHFRKLIAWLEPLGVQIAWLTGSQKKKERAEMLAMIASGGAGLVVGTHAVIQEQVQFRKLALAIIDEQHRFGVAQRLALRSKTQEGDLEPHMLMMTATPIPRTLAMSYYADLDVSTIDELPPGRSSIVTKVVSEQRRAEVIERIRAQIVQGRQVYWVCPLIEESEALDLANATQTHAQLSAALNQADDSSISNDNVPAVMVGLLHSRMPVAEKKSVMASFASGEMGVLVSTTVIEVGVDVPNATLMVIEHAERFGLSQLHQLRGRVGRGAGASACVLLYATGEAPRLSQTARDRLRAMAQTNDGFEIARRDLDIRGPGDFLGSRQSGEALLRFADLNADSALLAWARKAAPIMLDRYPDEATRHLHRWLGGRTDFLKA